MCFEEGKARIVKGKSTMHPLITNKKYLAEAKDKQNQKHNLDLNTKPRGYYANEMTTTTEFEHKYANHHVNFGHGHSHLAKERYPASNTNNHQTSYIQNTRTMTFANVKHNNNKAKENSLLLDQPTYLTHEPKKTAQIPKTNVLFDKDKFTDRVERPLIETKPKDNNRLQAKIGFTNKNPIVTAHHTFQLDDFACTEELEFKPVEKKSIVPTDKKYNNDKTTSKFDFTKVRKVDKKTETKELKQFQNQEKLINMIAEGEALNLLCLKQEEYKVDPKYFEKNHPKLLWWSRAILVDWMRHICYEFSLQRDTYHIAVVLLDNYLAKISNVPKMSLQAIGATTLFIASKLQEFQCKESRQFAKATNNSCSVEKIHELQIHIVMTLRFKLNPPTLFSLANKTMSQWDIFMTSNDYSKVHPLFSTAPRVHFKQLDQNSYRMFRQMMQLIDCCVIDIQTVQYQPKMLICSFLYLLIGREMNIFRQQDILEEFPGSSRYLIDQSDFNDVFRAFLQHVFGFSLFDILPSVQYCATYFGLTFSYEKPMINEDEDLESMSLQEYCSYQTYNSTMIKTVKHRYRGIY